MEYLKRQHNHHFPLYFAPMEGITDESYRLAVHHLDPHWDFQETDFLRCPSQGRYPAKIVRKHLGERVLARPELLKKSVYQILTTPQANTRHVLDHIANLGIRRLDLNLGCPSKTVFKHGGGSALLGDLADLKKVIADIRAHWPYHFQCKIRVGVNDDLSYLDILHLIQEEGADQVVIHGRSRAQLYKGVANWDYFSVAKKSLSIPVVANGDVWSDRDIDLIKNYTGADGVMIARGAMKTPFLASLYTQGIRPSQEEFQKKVIEFLKVYLEYCPLSDPLMRLRRLKAITRYSFDDVLSPEKKRMALRSKSLAEFFEHASVPLPRP